jgi:c-di-GMP-binding flagellar brake protein YcgR
LKDWSGVKDRRKLLRLKTALFVSFKVDKHFYLPHLAEDEEIEAITLDISQNGLALLSKHQIPCAASLIISCRLIGVDKKGTIVFSHPLELRGEVRSSLPWGQKEYRLGISFTEISPEDKKQISEFISSVITGTFTPAQKNTQ